MLVQDIHLAEPRTAAPPPRAELSEATVSALEAELRGTIQGEVRFDRGSRALYATDGSNYRQVPIGVTCPRSKEDVEAIVAACRRHGAPLLSRGGGTSLAGQCCNTAVVMDFSKYMYEVLEVDPDHKAVLTMKAEERLYDKRGMDYEVLDSGCCGMAGSFGFEKEHYSISVACGERALLPAVRQAEESTLIVADGFSCREQISQLTHRKAKHTAEILQMAINGGREPRPAGASPAKRRLGWMALAAGALAGVAAALLIRKTVRS